MINRNHAEQIRACERIKFDQALYILTMYQKKIRKSRKAIPGVVDADTEMQDIICSWKNKWKMDLTKPILNCVTSVYPRVLVDTSRQDNQQLGNYYTLINRFLNRLRTEHEDETNFKLVLQVYDRHIEYMSTDKYQACSKATVKGLLTMSRDFANSQLQNLLGNLQLINNESLEVNMDNLEWQVYRPLRWVREVARRALLGEGGMEVQNDIQPKCEKTQSLISFCSNVVRLMERIKQSQHGSTLVTVQPKIDELTLLFHPLLVAISANLKKQQHEKNKDFNWPTVPVESIPMMQSLKSSYNCSRVVLINLDGYESEYNLEIARNFKKHLLYISFPKEEAKLNQVRQIYSRRFFKKLMFRYSQGKFESFGEGTVSEDYRAITRMERLSSNPEDYHCAAERLYDIKNDKSGEDFNQNIYVFPLRMAALYEHFPEVMESREDMQNHESYFIRFIIKDFLLNQIRQFNPTLIMLSYSGRLHIQDHHFVELLQELTKIANYKLLLFPNLTSAFVSEEQTPNEDDEGQPCEYDNFVVDARISGPLHSQQGGEEEWTELFDKTARFLKVSSGTYNLNRSFEEEPLVSKYKNQFILTYIDELMTVLGKEYPNIDKIRFRNHDLSILPKLFEENIRNIKKTFEHTVPRLYIDIYDLIEYLLLERVPNPNPKREQQLSDYGVEVGEYADLLDRLYDEILQKSNFEVVGVDFESMGDEVEQARHKKMREVFNSLRESHMFEISSEKYEEKRNIFIKLAPENKEYASIAEETQSLRGLFETSFYLAGKIALKLYESTKVLHMVDQRAHKSNRIPLLIMNNLTDAPYDYSFENYYSEIDITNAYQANDKKVFEERKCLAVPLQLQNEKGEVEPRKRTYLLTQWNYHQSENYLMLYWPSRYDFFKAFLLKMMNQSYQPPILSDVYLCRKGNKTPIFRKVPLVVDSPISARMGTSPYEFEGKVFIFGGFYQREKNYLELQHDITTFDLRAFDATGQTKLITENIKTQLYGRGCFEQRLADQQKPNSFVRPRLQFQFFDREQLFGQQQVIPEEGTKTVVMMGGYGQNFLRPYSLLTYYYYLLRFDRQGRRLSNVQKKIIYNKAIPVNTREMTKNLGVIKTNKKTKNSLLQPKKLTDPDAYTLYRNSFRIDMKDGEEDFNYKFKYMFSEDQYKNFKHQIKKIQEQRAEEFDSTSVTVERDPKNNHRITLEKDGKKKDVHLKLQIPQELARKLEVNTKLVNLTHESIIYLDIWSSIICAIVKHDKYTNGKSILVQYDTKNLEALNFEQDVFDHIAMSWVKEFEEDLTLHILIICNKNTMAILHGEKLTMVNPLKKLKQYIVKRKKSEIAPHEIREREQLMRRNEESSLINTIFFRNRNKILSIDFIALNDCPYFYISCQEIELNIAKEQYRWTAVNVQKFDPTTKYEFCFSEKNFVRMEQLRFLQFYKSTNEYFLIVEHNRKKYVCELHRGGRVLILEEGTIKTEVENMERGSILVKTEDKYNDRDFC